MITQYIELRLVTDCYNKNILSVII